MGDITKEHNIYLEMAGNVIAPQTAYQRCRDNRG